MTPGRQPKQTTPDPLAELEAFEHFDERSIPLERRIGIIRTQIAEWTELAYSSRTAYQIQRGLGVTTAELAPLVVQFTRARAACVDLGGRLAQLEAERPSERVASA